MTAIKNAGRLAIGRRDFLGTIAGAAGALGLAACATDAKSAATLTLDSQLPTSVPAST